MPIPEVEEIFVKYKSEEERIENKLLNANQSKQNHNKSDINRQRTRTALSTYEEAKMRNKALLKVGDGE